MKTIGTIFGIIFFMILSLNLVAQTAEENKLTNLADENVVMIIAKVADVAALKTALDAKIIKVAFTNTEDMKGKKAVGVAMKIISLNTDNADFDNSKGIIVIEGEFKEGNTSFYYKGNLSLVTLKGMGNLDLKI